MHRRPSVRPSVLLFCAMVVGWSGCDSSEGGEDGGPDDDGAAQVLDGGLDDGGADGGSDSGFADGGGDGGTGEGGPCGTCANTEAQVVYDAADTYTPTGAAELADPANAGRVAILANAFDVGGAVLAAGQILVPAGGGLTGIDIDLNGATIVLNDEQAFAPSARFGDLYRNGCLSPELFGAADAANDAAAIEAMIVNGERGLNRSEATYNVDSATSYTGRRTFTWNGNGSTIEANTDFGGRIFLFSFDGVRPEICDLEIDGNDTLSFGIEIAHTDFYLNGFHLHNLLGDEGESCLGVSFELYTAEASDVQILNSEFHDFEYDAVSDGNPSGSAGVVRSLIVWYNEVDSPCEILIQNTRMYSNYGKGEAIHLFNNGNQNFDHDVIVTVDNCDFWDNTRRDIKAQTSGLRVRNSRFTQIASDSPHLRNVTPTANISFALDDTPGAADYHVNAEVTDSTFDCETTPNSSFVGLTDVRDIVVSGNDFRFPEANVHNAVLIQAKHLNNLLENNAFTNCGIVVGVMGDEGATTVQHNTFTYNVSGSPQSAVIRSSLSNGVYQNLVFDSNDVTVNFANAARNFYGLYGAHLPGQRHINVTLTNNTVTYTGDRANQRLMVVAADFGPGNTISNNTCPGVTPAGALQIDGARGFTNTNNTDGSGAPLTVGP